MFSCAGSIIFYSFFLLWTCFGSHSAGEIGIWVQRWWDSNLLHTLDVSRDSGSSEFQGCWGFVKWEPQSGHLHEKHHANLTAAITQHVSLTRHHHGVMLMRCVAHFGLWAGDKYGRMTFHFGTLELKGKQSSCELRWKQSCLRVVQKQKQHTAKRKASPPFQAVTQPRPISSSHGDQSLCTLAQCPPKPSGHSLAPRMLGSGTSGLLMVGV